MRIDQQCLFLGFLLTVDLILWYNISSWEIAWILLITFTLIIVSSNRTISLNGVGYVLLSVIFSVVNISIVKYWIENYNSLESQMLIIQVLVSIIMFFVVLFQKGLNWIAVCFNPKYFVVGVFNSLNVLFNNIALLFGPASVVTALRKVWEVIWWVVFWKVIFDEKKFLRKIWTALILIIWVFIINMDAFGCPSEFFSWY